MFLNAEVSHHYDAEAVKVFDAWLDPALVGKWMFGPPLRDEQVVSIDIDPREGGAFSFLVNRQNTVIDHVGTYRRIERPTYLEFNWGVKGMSDDSRVMVSIKPAGPGCRLKLIHELHPDWKEYLERAVAGWQQMLSLLDSELKKAG